MDDEKNMNSLKNMNDMNNKEIQDLIGISKMDGRRKNGRRKFS